MRPCAQGSQLKMCRSVPHTLAASTRTSTWPGPGVGTGTSRTSIPGAELGLDYRLHGSGHTNSSLKTRTHQSINPRVPALAF